MAQKYLKKMDGWMDIKIYEKNMDGWMDKKIEKIDGWWMNRKKQMDGRIDKKNI